MDDGYRRLGLAVLASAASDAADIRLAPEKRVVLSRERDVMITPDAAAALDRSAITRTNAELLVRAK